MTDAQESQKVDWEEIVKKIEAPYRKFVKEELGKLKTPLYHYTTPSGFLGILQKRRIWATHMQHFNDAGEVQYAKEVREAALDSYVSKLERDNHPARKLRAAKDIIGRHRHAEDIIDMYAASFSSKPDVLSQWARYATPHGYSIGFDPTFLATTGHEGSADLVPVVYKEDQQTGLVDQCIDAAFECLAQNPKISEDQELVTWWAIYCVRIIEFMSASFKNEAFQEEAEWRIVRRENHLKGQSIKLRPGPFGVIPYVEHRLPLANPGDILDIMIAPTNYPEESKRAVELCLNQSMVSIDATNIRVSDVKLRV